MQAASIQSIFHEPGFVIYFDNEQQENDLYNYLEKICLIVKIDLCFGDTTLFPFYFSRGFFCWLFVDEIGLFSDPVDVELDDWEARLFFSASELLIKCVTLTTEYIVFRRFLFSVSLTSIRSIISYCHYFLFFITNL